MTTLYVALRQDGKDEGVFELVGRFEAAGAPAARREAAKDADQAGGYVAVPLRSFEVEHLEIERNSRVVKAKSKDAEPDPQTSLTDPPEPEEE
jgi:hypothetical protein